MEISEENQDTVTLRYIELEHAIDIALYHRQIKTLLHLKTFCNFINRGDPIYFLRSHLVRLVMICIEITTMNISSVYPMVIVFL